MLSCVGQRARLAITEVMCDCSPIMADEELSSPGVRVFMIEKKALWYEFEHVDSQQGNSLEGNFLADVLSARALSQEGVGPSGRPQGDVDSDDTKEVNYEEAPENTGVGMLEVEFDAESYPGEGMLLKNPRSTVKTEDIMLWRYMYIIPLSVKL